MVSILNNCPRLSLCRARTLSELGRTGTSLLFDGIGLDPAGRIFECAHVGLLLSIPPTMMVNQGIPAAHSAGFWRVWPDASANRQTAKHLRATNDPSKGPCLFGGKPDVLAFSDRAALPKLRERIDQMVHQRIIVQRARRQANALGAARYCRVVNRLDVDAVMLE